VRSASGALVVHNCGYQGGASAIERFAAKEGIDLEAAGVTPQDIVDAWRAAHPAVVKFWHDVERAFAGAVKGRASRVSAFEFVPADDGSAVAIILPSGRPIVYARAGSDRVRRTSRAGRPYVADELYYWGRDDSQNAHKAGGFKRITTYGGKLTENIIQAVCRELMAEALVRVEHGPKWLRPVMTVHDEIVCLAPEEKSEEALALLERTMVELPEWADGFPIGADGYVSKRYKK
jgi:DNA polymerase